MVRTGQVLLVVGTLGVWLGALPPRSRADELPSSPVPVVVTTLPHPQPAVPGPPTALLGDAAICAPGPPACTCYEDCNGPLLYGDPLLDRPCAPPPGWFTNLELAAIVPHIKSHLTAPVNINGLFVDQVQVPLDVGDWTPSPRVDLGYRFGQGFGEVLLSYRSVISEGNSTITDFDVAGNGQLSSRLNVNVVDLDYASREFSLGPRWDMKWRVGVRFGDVFFDSRAQGIVVEERASNHYIGVGPHAGLDLAWDLPCRRLALFGRLDGAALLGRISQSYEEAINVANILTLGGATDVRGTQAVPVGRIQAGLQWTPDWVGTWLRFTTGYELESWWYVGQVGDSDATLTMQGVFFRCEWKF